METGGSQNYREIKTAKNLLSFSNSSLLQLKNLGLGDLKKTLDNEEISTAEVDSITAKISTIQLNVTEIKRKIESYQNKSMDLQQLIKQELCPYLQEKKWSCESSESIDSGYYGLFIQAAKTDTSMSRTIIKNYIEYQDLNTQTSLNESILRLRLLHLDYLESYISDQQTVNQVVQSFRSKISELEFAISIQRDALLKLPKNSKDFVNVYSRQIILKYEFKSLAQDISEAFAEDIEETFDETIDLFSSLPENQALNQILLSDSQQNETFIKVRNYGSCISGRCITITFSFPVSYSNIAVTLAWNPLGPKAEMTTGIPDKDLVQQLSSTQKAIAEYSDSITIQNESINKLKIEFDDYRLVLAKTTDPNEKLKLANLVMSISNQISSASSSRSKNAEKLNQLKTIEAQLLSQTNGTSNSNSTDTSFRRSIGAFEIVSFEVQVPDGAALVDWGSLLTIKSLACS